MANHDDVIKSKKINAERKKFFVDLKKNARGKVVKITEAVGEKRDAVMVPSEYLAELIAALTELKQASDLDDKKL